ncbi:hypothetical protein [Herbidospora solisilvae]|nr:hypothetical protein [Herbidospora solisilvae]
MSDQLIFSYGAGPAGRELDGHPDALPGFRPETVKTTNASIPA